MPSHWGSPSSDPLVLSNESALHHGHVEWSPTTSDPEPPAWNGEVNISSPSLTAELDDARASPELLLQLRELLQLQQLKSGADDDKITEVPRD